MTGSGQDRSTEFVRWWVRLHTAGLDPEYAAARQAEIDSDLVEHRHFREHQGWSTRQITRERLARLARGMPSDLRWRREVLQRSVSRGVELSLAAVTGLASLLLALFHLLFAAYLMGSVALAEQRFLGGMADYADEVGRPIATSIAALIVASLGVALAVAVLTRPISPLVANVVTTAIAVWSVLFFWLGVWPIGLIAVGGSTIDLVMRNPQTRLP